MVRPDAEEQAYLEGNTLMKSRKRVIRTLSMLVFSVGVFLGLALSAGAVWGDLEATLFDVSLSADAPLKTLKCPVMVTASESGTVAATFSNPTGTPISPMIRTHISHGYVTLTKENHARLRLAPGETQQLQWPVTSDDAAYGRLILVRIVVLGQYPLPSRQGSCGILVINLPKFTGNQVVAFALVTNLSSMMLGVALWAASDQPLSRQGRAKARAMSCIAATVFAAVLFALWGWWVLGGVLWVIAILLIAQVVMHFWLTG
jgi:hypothetical protein